MEDEDVLCAVGAVERDNDAADVLQESGAVIGDCLKCEDEVHCAGGCFAAIDLCADVAGKLLVVELLLDFRCEHRIWYEIDTGEAQRFVRDCAECATARLAWPQRRPVPAHDFVAADTAWALHVANVVAEFG